MQIYKKYLTLCNSLLFFCVEIFVFITFPVAKIAAVADFQPTLVGRTHPCSPAYAFRSNRGYRSLALTHRASSPLSQPLPPYLLPTEPLFGLNRHNVANMLNSKRC